MSVATKPMLTSKTGKELWVHSIRCAVGAKLISEELELNSADEAFVAGLLHDIGKSVMEIYDSKKMKELQDSIHGSAYNLALEEQIFGFNHSEIGAALANKWKLPALISECIRFHHDPLNSDQSLASVIYVADCLSQESLSEPIFNDEIMENLDFDIPDLEELRQEIFESSELMLDAL